MILTGIIMKEKTAVRFASGLIIQIEIQKKTSMNLMSMYSAYAANMLRYSMEKSIFFTQEMNY